MKKELRMIQVKKEQVAERLELVEEACSKLIEKNIRVTYSNISVETNIPKKTLEREPYVNIIRNHRERNNNTTFKSTEVKALEQKCEYQKLIIEQLRKQIKNLNTELYKSRV